MPSKVPYSRQVRLDPVTYDLLDELSLQTYQTKCSLIRSYVSDGVAKDIQKLNARNIAASGKTK